MAPGSSPEERSLTNATAWIRRLLVILCVGQLLVSGWWGVIGWWPMAIAGVVLTVTTLWWVRLTAQRGDGPGRGRKGEG